MAESNSPAKPARRVRKMQALGATVNKLTHQAFGQRGLNDGQIVRRWPEIIGPMLARNSLPEKITYTKGQRGRGTLYLRVANSGLATEIQHLEPMVLDRVNTYFGYQAVARLKLIHAPLPEPEPETAPVLKPLNAEQAKSLSNELSTVIDPELKAALAGLGQSVIGRGRKKAAP